MSVSIERVNLINWGFISNEQNLVYHHLILFFVIYQHARFALFDFSFAIATICREISPSFYFRLYLILILSEQFKTG